MTDRITDEQVQELTNHISDKCQNMGLEPEQIIDGIARALNAAADTFIKTGNSQFQIEMSGLV